MVWAWSSERVMQDAEGGPLLAPRRIFPESLFRGRPMVDGEELLAMDEGFEGRVWRGAQLVASHWWRSLPGVGEWNEFRRGAGARSEDRVPEPLQLPLESGAWGTSGARGMGELVQQQRVLLAAVAVAAVTALLVAQLVGALALKASIYQVQNDIAARETAIAEILTARENAQADALAVEQQLRMRPPAGQTALLAAVARLIPGRWQLLKWEMPDSEHLKVNLRMAGVDPRRIVEAWEKSGQFTEVTAEVVRQPDELQVKARILRARASK